METISVQDNQTLLDVALQYYGNVEAIGEIVSNNSSLANETSAVLAAGRELGYFYPDIKLAVGSTLQIDDDSRLMKKTVVKKIERDITTYMTEQWQEQLNK